MITLRTSGANCAVTKLIFTATFFSVKQNINTNKTLQDLYKNELNKTKRGYSASHHWCDCNLTSLKNIFTPNLKNIT